MKDAVATIALVSAATALGVMAYPGAPILAVTACTVTRIAVCVLAVAKVIERQAHK